MPGSARRAALQALERCRKDGAWSAQAMDRVIRSQELERRESALASRLCLGVLQNDRYLDHYIDHYCTRNGDKLEPKLRDILRLGAYQLLFLDKIPPRAAVNESVALCRGAGLDRASGLVNAVLRRLAENRDKLPPIPGEGTAEWLSIRYSHPLWLAERLMREHDYAFAEAFLAADNQVPPLCLQVNTLRVSPAEYCRMLDEAEIAYETHPELPGCLTLSGGAVTELPGYGEGLFYVQDRAARTAVEIAGPEPGMQVLDACAAPGGKSFAAALRMQNTGSICACDIHEKKLERIRSGAERLGITILSVEARDARQPLPECAGRFDLVLADVPCSGLGVIGKRPEIRRKTEAEIAGLPEIQRAILENLSDFVKPGGTLLYSTCTVLDAENRDVVTDFLRRHEEFAPAAFSVGDRASRDGMYTFWPQIDGTDGFFAAKLIRIN